VVTLVHNFEQEFLQDVVFWLTVRASDEFFISYKVTLLTFVLYQSMVVLFHQLMHNYLFQWKSQDSDHLAIGKIRDGGNKARSFPIFQQRQDRYEQ
jgi:hypothetical protein